MFEKSLYDLIRGLRNHKGNEKEYIQASIRECRKEIKSQDMDLKATAVLKLTYLEMFGHDMSWASFNVLETMSSPKPQLKRIGYLGAIQSFRPDTEIIMLAENLLKKDLNSPQIPTITQALVAIPHVISPSMANSLLSDLLPRLSHSNPFIRKKTIVTLYRLALVYPETLRPAWPKIKERLLDEKEESSVTAAVVNVVCELGWRRPRDFLPLAPRLFDLLVEGNNNWMAIKIIKLFTTLTPLEPRLVKKLLPPLTTIIKTTPAMSLLYECINGIVQGGLLQSVQGSTEGDEIARLCVGKLRGMLVIEGDPNLKYVALLAFAKIVDLHPYLVSAQEDVIMECLDDPDISIRFKALDLVVGMVNPSNLVSLVDRLMRQLQNSPIASGVDDPLNDRGFSNGVEPAADSDDDDAAQSIRRHEQRSNRAPPLPEDYRQTVIERILQLCSSNMYSNVGDFDWYVDLLVQLVKQVPAPVASHSRINISGSIGIGDTAYAIGCELRNVAVRVRSSRSECSQAAERLVSITKQSQLFPRSHNGGQGVLEPVVWIIGEYPDLLAKPEQTLESLMHASVEHLPPSTLSAYLHAAVKILTKLIGDPQRAWTEERKTMVLLAIAKVTDFLEPLTSHPNLEVQERAVEYLELTRLAAEASTAHKAGSGYGEYTVPPLLLTQAIPSLFSGSELNPVAKDAQRKVPILEGLDLDTPINDNLTSLLNVPDFHAIDDDEFDKYYYEKPVYKAAVVESAATRLQAAEEFSYQQSNGILLGSDQSAKKKDRKERNKDDPFYIPSEDNSGTATPIHSILKGDNGDVLDVDSIPIMELNLRAEDFADSRPKLGAKGDSGKRKPRRHVEILADENIGDAQLSSGDSTPPDLSRITIPSRTKKTLLQVDSSGLGSLSLEESALSGTPLDIERHQAEEAEMLKAMKEVERLRLEMQRASETIEATVGPPEGVVVKRKKKRTVPTIISSNGVASTEAGASANDGTAKKKKKKAKVEHEAVPEPAAFLNQEFKTAGNAVLANTDDEPRQMQEEDDGTEGGEAGMGVMKKKKKKRRQATIEDETLPSASAL